MTRNYDTREKQSVKITMEILERVRHFVMTQKLKGKKIVVRGGVPVELSYTSYIEDAILKQLAKDQPKNVTLKKYLT